MSVGTVISLVVLIELVVLLGAVRWLVSGIRSAECRDWPPVRPLTPASAVPNPRDSSGSSESMVAAS